MNKKKRVYLMAPYSHKDIRVCEERFNIANNVSAFLMDQGYIVFSPLSHSHPISMSDYAKETDTSHLDHGVWLEQDFAWLQFCEGYFILRIKGWEKSTGVSVEKAMCSALSEGAEFYGYIDYDSKKPILEAFNIVYESMPYYMTFDPVTSSSKQWEGPTPEWDTTTTMPPIFSEGNNK